MAYVDIRVLRKFNGYIDTDFIIRYIIRNRSDGYLPLYTHIALAFALAHDLSALTSAWQSIRMWICVERRCREERHCAEGDVGEIFLLLLLWMCGVGGGVVRVVVGVQMAGLGLGLGLRVGVIWVRVGAVRCCR
jgi:hypothetical protein